MYACVGGSRINEEECTEDLRVCVVEELCETAESLPFVLLIQNPIVAQARVQGESPQQIIV